MIRTMVMADLLPFLLYTTMPCWHTPAWFHWDWRLDVLMSHNRRRDCATKGPLRGDFPGASLLAFESTMRRLVAHGVALKLKVYQTEYIRSPRQYFQGSRLLGQIQIKINVSWHEFSDLAFDWLAPYCQPNRNHVCKLWSYTDFNRSWITLPVLRYIYISPGLSHNAVIDRRHQ